MEDEVGAGVVDVGEVVGEVFACAGAGEAIFEPVSRIIAIRLKIRNREQNLLSHFRLDFLTKLDGRRVVFLFHVVPGKEGDNDFSAIVSIHWRHLNSF